MSSPISNRIGTIFIPVKNLEKSAEWYSRILGLPLKKVSPPVYNLDIDGTTGLTLDVGNFSSTIRDGEVQPSPNGLFYFCTSNIEDAYHFLKEIEVELSDQITYIGNAALFQFKDLDGNIMMVYKNA